MFKGLANLGSIMRQAQQMGSKMQDVQEQLKAERATGSSGGGMVTAEVNGLGDVLKVTIEPHLVENGDREMIEDLIPAAVNQCHRHVFRGKMLENHISREKVEFLVQFLSPFWCFGGCLHNLLPLSMGCAK